jgi:hypothetical protein
MSAREEPVVASGGRQPAPERGRSENMQSPGGPGGSAATSR